MKYKIGDKVEIIKAIHEHPYRNGTIVWIKKVDEDDKTLTYKVTNDYYVSENEIKPVLSTKELIKELIQSSDEQYLTLTNDSDYFDSDVQYMKGVRDGRLSIYNLVKDKI